MLRLGGIGLRFVALMVAILVVTTTLIVFFAPTLVQEAYTWSTLYLGGAIVSAIGAVVAIPFAIWVLYMQSRFGSVIVRLFLPRVLVPFSILILSIAVTAIAMIISFSQKFYVIAYAMLIVESVTFIPAIAIYVLKLMTLKPTEVIETIAQNSRDVDEGVRALLRLASTYILESPIEESAVTAAMRRVITMLARGKAMEKNPPSPTTWHAMRSFLNTLVRENVALPSRKIVGALMKVFMQWLLIHGKDRAARMLMRHYRRVAIRYLDIRMPSEIVSELILDPIIDPVESTNVKEELRVYAYEQLNSFLNHIRVMVLRGEIPSRELCTAISIVEKRLEKASPSAEIVRETIDRLKKEFRCAQRYVRKRRAMKIASPSDTGQVPRGEEQKVDTSAKEMKIEVKTSSTEQPSS